MKFEDRSHEGTERQQRCAQSKLKEKDKTTFHSHPEECVLPVTSIKAPEEREFVVDSGASLHMVSMKDVHSAELETVVTSCGEVQTREEATVNVKELDQFVTVMLLGQSPAVLSLGKLCVEYRKSPKKSKRIDYSISNYVPFVVPGLSTNSSTSPSPTSSTSLTQDSVLDIGRYTEKSVPERSGSTSAVSGMRVTIVRRTKDAPPL